MEKTKEYLKMADVFPFGTIVDADQSYNGWAVVNIKYENGNMTTIDESGDGGFYEKTANYISHAINSHDELVAEVERLRSELADKDMLLDCTREVIRYCREALYDDDAAIFLRLWSDAEWDVLRKEFPDADDIIYAADPLWSGWNAKEGGA